MITFRYYTTYFIIKNTYVLADYPYIIYSIILFETVKKKTWHSCPPALQYYNLYPQQNNQQ